MPFTDHRLEAITKNDPVMAKLAEQVGGYHLRRTQDGWEALASAVIFQQVAGKAAATLSAKIRHAHDGQFPTPAQVDAAALGTWKGFGLTAAKEETMRALAQRILAGRLNLQTLAEKHPNLIHDVLTDTKGVGRWTVQMWRIFHLGHDDVFMPGDLGLRKAIAIHYGQDLARLTGRAEAATKPTPAELEAFAQRWAPYRTVASYILWKSDPKFPEPGLAPAGA